MRKILPSGDLIGSDLEHQIEARQAAREHLQHAIASLAEVAPHGRDYTERWAAMHLDREEYIARSNFLHGLCAVLLDELEEITAKHELRKPGRVAP